MLTRSFDLDDQLAFAELSGDFNPMHVDPLVARRLFSGAPVVHGIHLLLVAIESCLADPAAPAAARLRSVTAKFRRPVLVGQAVEFRISAGEAGGARGKIVGDGHMLASIDLAWEPAGPHERHRSSFKSHGTCRRREAGDLATASGSMHLDIESAVLGRLLPGLVGRLPEQQVAQLAATSRLVGMECPGLNSIYGELHAEFPPVEERAERLDYEVTEFDDRYASLTIRVRSAGLEGRIQAFVRPEPVAQPGAATLRPRVAPDAFAGQRALVVGGSRGVGEVTAKLLAVGGADVRITYARGRADAEAVVADIVAAGGRAEALAYDVVEPGDALCSRLGGTWQPTHVYCFATPPLAAGSVGTFSQAAFAAFSRFYVAGFADTVLAVRSCSPALRAVFYPSTVALDAPPGSMAEYAAAKAAGEALCDYFGKHLRGIRFFRTRLPRMGTDLTASLLPVATQDVVDVMLERLAEFTGG